MGKESQGGIMGKKSRNRNHRGGIVEAPGFLARASWLLASGVFSSWLLASWLLGPSLEAREGSWKENQSKINQKHCVFYVSRRGRMFHLHFGGLTFTLIGNLQHVRVKYRGRI